MTGISTTRVEHNGNRIGVIMGRKRFSGMVLFVCGVIYLLSIPSFSAEHHHTQKARQIAALVDSAAALIESKGQAAFAEFAEKGGRWYQGETYVFVDGMDGTVLVNPPSPEIVGTNLRDSKDARGKMFMREFIETAKTKGAGWVDYWWPEPGTRNPVKKMSYLRKATMPDGKTVIVGAGIYVEGK
jgi:cytochrome c